jgi:peroxiredoxin
MKELGSPAPDFSLLEPREGAPGGERTVSLTDYAGKPLLVAFICNHCPYVIHIGHKLGELTRSWADSGLGIVLINANDTGTHPDDAPEKMPAFARSHGITAPYLFDASQAVAKAYHAACTPDFFLYDAGHKLVYRGQFDSARPRNEEPVTGADLAAAVEALLAGDPVPVEQRPSAGCNIKWKRGNEPPFYTLR